MININVKYSDSTLLGMRKSNLVKYVRRLEEMIWEYDDKLHNHYKAIEYIDRILNNGYEVDKVKLMELKEILEEGEINEF